MKRILSICLCLGTLLPAKAQIPEVGDPVCAICEVDLKSQQPHKRGCPYYSEPQDEEETSKPSTKLKDYTPQQESKPEQKPATNPRPVTNYNPAPSSQHITSAKLNNPNDIKRKYDKKLSFSGFSSGTAYCRTHPNGKEEWVLYSNMDREVGTYSKIEKIQAGAWDIFLVRDDRGRWGMVHSGMGSPFVEPQYESIKYLKKIDSNYPYFEVTKRDENGILRHGLYYMTHGETLPCEFDNVQLLDRCPNSTLAIVKVGGNLAIANATNGDILIQPGYSYVNTYFTRKKGMYFIIGDSNGLGAVLAETMEMVVPITNGNSLDKVKKKIEEEEKQ